MGAFEYIHEDLAAETMVGDIMKFLVDELKQMPKPYQTMSQRQQQEVLDRMEKRVSTLVSRVVNIIASEDRTTITATLDKVEVSGGVKGVLIFPKGAPGLHDLVDCAKQEVLLVLANSDQYTKNERGRPTPEPDQKPIPFDGLDLERDDPVDAEFMESEAHAYAAHGAAAQQEPADTEAALEPAAEEVAISQPDEAAEIQGSGVGGEAGDQLYGDVLNFVVTTQKTRISSIQQQFKIGYNRAARLLEMLEANGIVSAENVHGLRNVLKTPDNA